MMRPDKQNDPLIIAGKEFRSRLIVGTGKYRTMDEMRDAIDASGAEMVTVAIRRLPLRQAATKQNLMDHLDWDRYTILPEHRRLQDRRRGAVHRPPGARADRLELGEAGGHPRPEVPAARPDRHAGGRARR